MSYYRIYNYPLNDKQYKHLLLYGCRNAGGGKAIERSENPERLPESLSRSRRLVRDYILSNPFEYFCTFTFDSAKVDRYSYKECSSKLTKFFNNIRSRKAPNFKYLVIPEFHEDGAIHFHGVISGLPDSEFEVPDLIYKRVGDHLEMVPNTPGYVRWKSYRMGHFNCSVIKNYPASANYISKYITKDLAAIPAGQKIVLHSTGLSLPELIYDCDDIPWMLDGCDYAGEYCKSKFTDQLVDLVPTWYGECCSDLSDPIEPEYEDIFQPLTGEQLSIYGKLIPLGIAK